MRVSLGPVGLCVDDLPTIAVQLLGLSSEVRARLRERCQLARDLPPLRVNLAKLLDQGSELVVVRGRFEAPLYRGHFLFRNEQLLDQAMDLFGRVPTSTPKDLAKLVATGLGAPVNWDSVGQVPLGRFDGVEHGRNLRENRRTNVDRHTRLACEARRESLLH